MNARDELEHLSDFNPSQREQVYLPDPLDGMQGFREPRAPDSILCTQSYNQAISTTPAMMPITLTATTASRAISAWAAAWEKAERRARAAPHGPTRRAHPCAQSR